jgi:DNA-binding response OmpR family regulator
VIDDDEMVRGVVTLMLAQAGFTVLIAKDGPSGLKEFREHPGGSTPLFWI